MFDKFKIMEYLLVKAFNRQRIYYKDFYEHFGGVDDDNMDEFNYAMESANKRIIKDILGNTNPLPIYTIILKKSYDALPSTGFYNAFSNMNRDLYKEIADDLLSQDVCRDPKYKAIKKRSIW